MNSPHQNSTPAGIESFLCACLRGESPPWPFAGDDVPAAFLERAVYHGVLPLLHAAARRGAPAWPEAALRACRDDALALAAWELRHRALLAEVLGALSVKNVTPVLIKGTALALTAYPEGELRSRGDTDLAIPAGSLDAVAGTLGRLGFGRVAGVEGEGIAYQADFVRREAGGAPHVLDVHWRIGNEETLSRLLIFEELLARARPVPALGPAARAACPVDALLVACLHRAGHGHNPYYVDGVAHYGGDRLVWLYDIHLLAARFDAGEWDEFARLAEAKGLRAVCLEGLLAARARLGTALPGRVEAALARAGAAERPARYLAAGGLRRRWMDFRAIPGAARKARFLARALFPSAGYMRARYPGGGWLPWLYARRAASGLFRRLCRAGHAP